MAKRLEKFTIASKARTTKYDSIYLECEKNLSYWTKFVKGTDFDDSFGAPSRKSIYCGIKLASTHHNKPYRGIAVRNVTDTSFEVALTARRIKVGPGQKKAQVDTPVTSVPHATVDTLQVSDQSIQANQVW